MLERVLPPQVIVVARRDDDLDAKLFPEEEEVIARSVPGRRREFATGRACARAALARLGVPPQGIPSGARGAPEWPDGVVGSITHCDGFRGCAVAWGAEFATIGVDAEVHAGLPDGLLGDIALSEERAQLTALARKQPQWRWDRLLFSIKESVYKAWFPLAERWLGFEDATVKIDPAERTFSARLLVPGPDFDGAELAGFSGRWTITDGVIVTAIAVPAKTRE
jgi:enterobactin synthetase component D / holo-[acyl-carrier protein] synthase